MRDDRSRLVSRGIADISARPRVPVPGWRVRECYGGFYWETFRDGVKVNGGIAENELAAVALAHFHLADRIAAPRLPLSR